MKSSPGLRFIAVATLCVLPFQACTSADVEFTTVSAAGSEPTSRAGTGGNHAAASGKAGAGSAPAAPDAGAGGGAGDAGEAGSSGDAARGGDSGRGGSSGGGTAHGGSAGRAGGGGGGIYGGGNGGNGGTSAGAAGAPAVCGNNQLDANEQCDDGNSHSGDACDASCRFEQSQRANAFAQDFDTSSFCRRNAFGAAFGRAGRSALQRSLSDRVADGSLSLLFAFRGLVDLTAASTESISLAVAYGAPAVADGYDGKNDRDWWYTPAAGQANGSELYSFLPASLAAGVLSANTGTIALPLLGGAAVTLSSVKLRLNIGASGKPLVSSGSAPGHLASEHLSSSLVSFVGGGLPADGDPGSLCGNISAASLAALAIPAAFTDSGSSPCTRNYSANRTFLDLLVGGCRITPGGVVLTATQPDQADANAAQSGAGAPYRFTTSSRSHAVSGCRDKNDEAVPLTTCLKAAAFSSAYIFKTGRVIIK